MELKEEGCPIGSSLSDSGTIVAVTEDECRLEGR